MSMIKCPECGKEISDKASTCPNCGYPIEIQEDVAPTTDIPNQPDTPKAKKKKHGCLTTLIIFLFLCFALGMFAKIGKNSLEKNTSEASSESLSSTLTKEEAKAMDEQIWGYVLPIINANNQFMETVGNPSATELDIYNAASALEKMCQDAWNDPPEINDENGKKYLNSCKDYILYEQTMAKSFQKYIDSKKTSDLSDAQKNIEACNQAISIAVSNRGVFLGINEFTDEEIQEIANNLGIEE